MTHRGGLVGAEARAPGDHRVNGSGIGDDRPVRISTRGRIEQAHLGAQHVGGGVERLAMAVGVSACARQRDAGPRQEVVGQALEVSGRRALGMDVGELLDHLAPGEGRALPGEATRAEHLRGLGAKARGVVGGGDAARPSKGVAKLAPAEAVLGGAGAPAGHRLLARDDPLSVARLALDGGEAGARGEAAGSRLLHDLGVTG